MAQARTTQVSSAASARLAANTNTISEATSKAMNPREAPTSHKEPEETDDDGDRPDAGEPEEPEEPKVRSLPITESLPGATGSGFLQVQGLLDGVEVARFDRRIYDLEGLERAELVLKNDCYGRISCPLGQTCVARECKIAPRPSEPPGCGE